MTTQFIFKLGDLKYFITGISFKLLLSKTQEYDIKTFVKIYLNINIFKTAKNGFCRKEMLIH